MKEIELSVWGDEDDGASYFEGASTPLFAFEQSRLEAALGPSGELISEAAWGEVREDGTRAMAPTFQRRSAIHLGLSVFWGVVGLVIAVGLSPIAAAVVLLLGHVVSLRIRIPARVSIERHGEKHRVFHAKFWPAVAVIACEVGAAVVAWQLGGAAGLRFVCVAGALVNIPVIWANWRVNVMFATDAGRVVRHRGLPPLREDQSGRIESMDLGDSATVAGIGTFSPQSAAPGEELLRFGWISQPGRWVALVVARGGKGTVAVRRPRRRGLLVRVWARFSAWRKRGRRGGEPPMR